MEHKAAMANVRQQRVRNPINTYWSEALSMQLSVLTIVGETDQHL